MTKSKSQATDDKTAKERDHQLEEKVKVERILVPMDGSSCSIRAAKYAIEAAKLQRAQIFCIHVIGSLPYGSEADGYTVQQYFEGVENEANSWFKKVNEMAKNEAIDEVKTDVITSVTSIIETIIKYAEDNLLI